MCLSNSMLHENARKIKSGLSDHCPIMVEIVTPTAKCDEGDQIKTRNLRKLKSNINEYKLHFASHPWEDIIKEKTIHDATIFFKKHFMDRLDILHHLWREKEAST